MASITPITSAQEPASTLSPLRLTVFRWGTPNPPGGVIQRDGAGNATGLLLAKRSALILYSTLAQGPKLPLEDQISSTRHYMREMNRLGITSVIDAGGGGQNFPDDCDGRISRTSSNPDRKCDRPWSRNWSPSDTTPAGATSQVW